MRFTAANNESAMDASPSNLPTNAFTMGCWFYLVSTSGGSQYFLTMYDPGENNDYFLVRVTSTGTVISTLIKVAATNTQLDSGGISTATWYYVVAGRSGANHFLKVFNADGTLLTDTSGTNQVTTDWAWAADREFNIGRLDSGSTTNDTDCRTKNVWRANSYITTNAILWATALASNPVIRGPIAFSNFYPSSDANDTRDFLGGDLLVLGNTPTTEDDPPTLPKRF